MTRMQRVEILLRVGAWIVLIINTISLLLIGFGSDITAAKGVGIMNCILFGIASVYLIAKWLKD